MPSLSTAEREFIISGLSSGGGGGIRYDGRELTSYRSIRAESDIFPHTNGSSRFQLGNTDLLCSVKLDIAPPLESEPSLGVVDVSVDLSPSVAQERDDKRIEQSVHIADLLCSVLLSSDALDRKALCIIPGKFCWNLSIDIVVVSLDCNLLDAASMAARVALCSTRIPKVQLIAGESGGPDDFEVSGDFSTTTALDASSVPILVTVHKVGTSFIIDASQPEVACASGALSVAVDKDGFSRSVRKLQAGWLSAVDIKTALALAVPSAVSLFPLLDCTTSTSTPLDKGLGQELGLGGNEWGMYADMPPLRKGMLL